MVQLFLDGGYPMWFLVLFGLGAVAASAFYARRPSRQQLRLTIGLGVTTLFSILTGIASDIAAVGHGAQKYLLAHPDQDFPRVLLQGLAECMSPAIMGFSLLSVTALLTAFGLWRRTADA